MQRSVVILRDVRDQSLGEIAAVLDLTVNAVKAHLARARARLKAINAQALAHPAPRPPSPAVARYVALFNRRELGRAPRDAGRRRAVDPVGRPDQLHPRPQICPLRYRRRRAGPGVRCCRASGRRDRPRMSGLRAWHRRLFLSDGESFKLALSNPAPSRHFRSLALTRSSPRRQFSSAF